MLNLPNSLTLGRIVAIFIFLILANIVEPDVWPYFTEDSIQSIKIFAFILATLAGLTDFFDGWAARKFNQVTDLGKLIDPLADKIFVSAIMLMMVEFHMMPAWIAVIVISREFMVTGLRMLALQTNVVIPADGWGKLRLLCRWRFYLLVARRGLVFLVFAPMFWSLVALHGWIFFLLLFQIIFELSTARCKCAVGFFGNYFSGV